jgi:hypothetical protein
VGNRTSQTGPIRSGNCSRSGLTSASALGSDRRTMWEWTPQPDAERYAGSPAADVLGLLDDAGRSGASGVELARTLWHVCFVLTTQGHTDLLVSAFHRALGNSDHSPVTHAKLLGVLGRFLKQARRPREFLELAGEGREEDERTFPPYTQAVLASERADALIMIGRPQQALDLLASLSPDVLAQLSISDQSRLRRNLAMVQRQAGAPDQAMTDLANLLKAQTARERTSSA